MLKTKESKGITLIALVITIIVLLILAGVTINAITGNESAMEKATEAREKNDLANELEQIKLCVVNAMSQGLDGKVSESHLRTELNGIVAQSEIEKITGNGPWIIQGNSGREYKITNGGLVNAIDTMDKAIISPISVEERSKVPIVISNGDNIEEIKSCTIADTSIATVTKDTDGIWKITGGTLTGELEEATTTMIIEGKSGKKIENIVITLNKVVTAEKLLKVNPSATTDAQKSPYVYYTLNGQTEPTLCRVLYNEGTPEDNGYGIQIITASTIGSVTLGLDDESAEGTAFTKVKNSYNNAVANLNKKAYDMRNTNLSNYARCVGCNPVGIPIINPNDDTTGYITFTGNNASITDCKLADENYTYDILRMNLLEVATTTDGKSYWFASRYCKKDGSSGDQIGLWFGSSVANNSGNGLSSFNRGYYFKNYSETKNFRPIFYIKPDAKIASGSGTSGDPYILEAGE